ncbi:hypothetical protein [Butyricimonas faecalis]|nr:hypothetical protein [Butyricimonas faecalis]
MLSSSSPCIDFHLQSGEELFRSEVDDELTGDSSDGGENENPLE